MSHWWTGFACPAEPGNIGSSAVWLHNKDDELYSAGNLEWFLEIPFFLKYKCLEAGVANEDMIIELLAH